MYALWNVPQKIYSVPLLLSTELRDYYDSVFSSVCHFKNDFDVSSVGRKETRNRPKRSKRCVSFITASFIAAALT